MSEKEKDELVEMRHVPGTCGATLRITRQGIIMSILCEAFPKHDLEDLAPLARRLYQEVVQPLEKELKDHHCESCDGSAKECGGPC